MVVLFCAVAVVIGDRRGWPKRFAQFLARTEGWLAHVYLYIPADIGPAPHRHYRSTVSPFMLLDGLSPNR